MKSKVYLVVVLTAIVAFGWLRSYEATPTQVAWSGWTPSGGNVGERFTANFDSITEVSLFCGTRGDTSHHYNLDVYDAQTNNLIAYRHNVAVPHDHSWLRFTSIANDGKFVRGRDYVVMFTRPNDSIQVYYRNDDPYKYGHIVVGGGGALSPGPQPWNPANLCARIYGLGGCPDPS
jgi:hypothetical protein